jgi:hypothetical protein
MDIEPVNSGSFSADKSDILKYLAEKYKLEFSGSKSEVIEYLNKNYPLISNPDVHQAGDRYTIEKIGTYEEQIEKYHTTNPFKDGSCIVYFMETVSIKHNEDHKIQDIVVSVEPKSIKVKINN